MATAGVVQDDGVKLALGLTLMLAGGQVVRGIARTINADLRSEGRSALPLLTELAMRPGSVARSRPALIASILDVAGFGPRDRRRRAVLERRLGKYDQTKLRVVLQALQEMKQEVR